jgi:hypothetical protein
MYVIGTGTGEPLEFVDMIVVGTRVAPIAGSTDDGSTITMVTGTGIGEPLGTGLRDIETTVITIGGMPGLMIGAAEIGTNTGRTGADEDGAGDDADAGEIEAGGETASIGTEGLTTGTEGLITNTGGILELGVMLEVETIKLEATLELGMMDGLEMTLEVGTMLELGMTIELGTTLELGIMLELE